MANYVYIACSLDGYIARKDGNLDWLMEIPNPEQSDYGFGDFMERIDGILMGRHTFETVLAFDAWPYPKPVFVWSSAPDLVPPALEGKAEVVSGDADEVLQILKQKGMVNLYIDGGRTIQGFLEKDLVDELIITRIPILLGSGIPLFGPLDRDLKFELVHTEELNKELVKSTYKRKR